MRDVGCGQTAEPQNVECGRKERVRRAGQPSRGSDIPACPELTEGVGLPHESASGEADPSAWLREIRNVGPTSGAHGGLAAMTFTQAIHVKIITFDSRLATSSTRPGPGQGPEDRSTSSRNRRHPSVTGRAHEQGEVHVRAIRADGLVQPREIELDRGPGAVAIVSARKGHGDRIGPGVLAGDAGAV